ncbi:hypothetical protein TrCOL_g12791 [Triparma columacea]|uniref:Ankyrin repeat protein n=1 Tax=Triparma columacea TaxID=722753 RepID=A0A9W7GDW0_9STRA|nr:hypothetical protein TrCOL_g12791 [Triparma columacea]
MDESGRLVLKGRIEGDGQVKINGVRLELGSIEEAMEDVGGVVDTAVAKVEVGQDGRAVLGVFVKLKETCREELMGVGEGGGGWIMVEQNSLLTLVRYVCEERVGKEGTPTYVAVGMTGREMEGIVGQTGKTDRKLLPLFSEVRRRAFKGEVQGPPLSSLGLIGKHVEDEITEVLNLTSKSWLTTDATLRSVGGDSLTATRIVRGIYARTHRVHNGRKLGGETGVLEGPWKAREIMGRTLGEYVEFLSGSGVEAKGEEGGRGGGERSGEGGRIEGDEAPHGELYGALMKAITAGWTEVALSILNCTPLQPKLFTHNGRMGKEGSRLVRKAKWTSTPLHLACKSGLPSVVLCLLGKGCRVSVPDSSGNFPIHLACLGDGGGNLEGYVKCVEAMIDVGGVPVKARDGNKHTIVIAAARGGKGRILETAIRKWREGGGGGIDDWDRWGRTAVHWCVMNGHVECLEILKREGADMGGGWKGKKGKGTSLKIETPKEIAERIYGEDGGEIGRILRG